MTSPTLDRRRILVLASTYPRWAGDYEPGFVHELCRRLSNDFAVTALVPDSPGADASGSFDGVEVVRYRYAPRKLQTLVFNGGIVTNLKRSKWKWLLLPGFVAAQYVLARRLLREKRFDAIHAHWLLPQGLLARQLAATFAIPFVVTSHGGDLFGLRGRTFNRLKQLVAADAAAMTVVSSAMRDEADKQGIDAHAMHVLPMGVDLQNRFVPDENVARDPNELLFVGRLVPKKGLPHLLKAMPHVLRKRPTTTLRIVGFGPEQAALKTLTRHLGLENAVIFAGAKAQKDLPALYRRAALFVAPFVRDDSGDQEGMPVVLMEAIGCGCPVVVGKVAGIEDLLGNAAADVCVEVKDSVALASVILSSLDAPDKAAERACTIRAAAVAHVDWQRIADAYAKVIGASIEQGITQNE